MRKRGDIALLITNQANTAFVIAISSTLLRHHARSLCGCNPCWKGIQTIMSRVLVLLVGHVMFLKLDSEKC